MSTSDAGATTIHDVLASLRRRQRRLNTARWAVQGILYGAIASALTAAAVLIAASDGAERLAWQMLALTPLATLLGAAAGAFLPINDLRLARAMDRATSGEDRFASALQLAGHPRRSRSQLIVDDALARVKNIPPAAALPFHLPTTLRWLPVPILAITVLMWLGPQPRLQAAPVPAPEISQEEWATLHDEFQREIEKLPDPQTREEDEFKRHMEELAKLLQQNPDKREVLKEIARLSDKVERQRRALGSRELNMKQAALAMASSQSLKKLASMLKQGRYTEASGEMQKLSQQLKDGKLSPDANEFEAIAADLQRLASELGDLDELQQEAQNAANAASSMNPEDLAEALRRLAEQMKKDAEQCRQSDAMGDYRKMLEELKRRMNQCSECNGCEEGCSQCNGNGNGNGSGRGAKKGGLKAGWGSATKWDGGSLAKSDEQRLPELVNPQERQGASTSFQVVSPDERAQSGLTYEELYANFVQKAEADLELESVPVAYRDYLRRYFNSIRPEEATPAADPEAQPE